ncbi:MAG: polymer-forming cytoskeletal protein, partial [Proteobacteria bacterium]|nr:polymer-forming cytoskeletal protein [Pseudomonadota bacterium]
SSLKGLVELVGKSTVDGNIEGEIHSTDELVIGENSSIKANIAADALIIYGKVEGDLRCNTRLELKKGSYVLGNILSPKVAVEDGAIFEGRCWMEKEAA